MDLAAVETDLTAWVEAVSGMRLHWRRQSNKAHVFPYIEAELLAIRSKGHDEKFWDYEWETDLNSLTMSGIRAMSVTLHFLSRSQKLGESARQYAELFRTKIYSPSSLQMLADANLALTQTLSLVDTDYDDRSGRMVSQVSLDLQFELRSSITDTSFAGDYIKTVDVSMGGYVVDEYGELVLDENGDYVATEDEPPTTIPRSS